MSTLTATSDYASLDAAVAALGSTVTTLIISTPLSVINNTTVPATLTLQFISSGSLSVPTTKTVTINGAIIASPTQQIFVLTGTGSVYVSSMAVMAPWYNSDISIAVTAIQTAVTANTAGVGDNSAPCHIIVPAGTYHPAGALTIKRFHVTLEIDGGAMIYVASGQRGIYLNGSSVPTYGYLANCTVRCDGFLQATDFTTELAFLTLDAVLLSNIYVNHIHGGAATPLNGRTAALAIASSLIGRGPASAGGSIWTGPA